MHHCSGIACLEHFNFFKVSVLATKDTRLKASIVYQIYGTGYAVTIKQIDHMPCS